MSVVNDLLELRNQLNPVTVWDRLGADRALRLARIRIIQNWIPVPDVAKSLGITDKYLRKRLKRAYPHDDLLHLRIIAIGNLSRIGTDTSKRFIWTNVLIERLGQDSDSKIAQSLGCSRSAVSYQRRIRNIPSYHKPSNTTKIKLNQAVIRRLGREPDYVIANSIGVSKWVIQQARVKSEILDFAVTTGNNGRIKTGEPNRRWKELQKKKSAELISLLGTMTDEELGDRYGLAKNIIWRERVKRKIPSYASVRDTTTRQRKWSRRKKRGHWPSDLMALLGKMTDAELGIKFGISPVMICAQRKKHNIQAFGKGKIKNLIITMKSKLYELS